MKRRLVNLAAAISLLLCLGTGALSVRSNSVGYHASWARRPLYFGVLVATQTVCLEFSGSGPRTIPFSFGSGRVWPEWTWEEFRDYLYPGDRVDSDSQGEWLGFGYYRGSYIDLFSQPRRATRVRVVGVHAPMALFTVLFGIPPLVVLLKSRGRERRALRGRCPACGYDLRASVERCPECGTSAAAKEACEVIPPPSAASR